MQKFGLQRTGSSKLNSVELEIFKEKATALGRAGKKLRISLEEYERLITKQANSEKLNQAIAEISDSVWQLILQREFLGFTEKNIDWIREHYVIPDEAISRIGRSNQ